MGISSTVHAELLPDTTIKHEAIPSFTADERVVIDVQVNDSEEITAARCYFRTDLDKRYLYVSMEYLGENNYQCFLPALSPGAQTVEYFFLIVNGSGQLIRSTPYLTSEAGTTEQQPAAVSSGVLNIYSELGDTEIGNTSIIDTQIHLMATPHSNQLYGLRAGVYEQIDIPESFGVMPGYFGGFILNPADNTIQPVKGFAPNMKPHTMGKTSAATTLSDDTGLQATSPQAEIVQKDTGTGRSSSDQVNIAGDDWVGYFNRTDTSYKLYLTASVSQNGSQVSITTTKSGLGHHLSGIMNVYGDMLLYDSYDGEDWTTHHGPARSTHIRIYDYAWPFEDGQPIPPLNRIILSRPPLPPTGVTASDGTFIEKVAVNWNFSDGAGSYLIYSCSSISIDDCQLLENIDTNNYDDTRGLAGKTYYRVQACDDLCSEFSDYDTGFIGATLAPILYLLYK